MPHKGLKKGHLEFELHGQKLNGRWHLVRMHGKPGEKRENWLLIKGDDEFARSADEADILEERPELINTGRTIDELEGEAPGWSSKTGKIEKPDGAGAAAKPSASASVSAKSLDASAIEDGAKGPLPGFVEPMLATLSKSPPTGDRWLHEIKFDGYRLQAHIEDGKVTLWTRGGLDWTKKFGDAVPAALRNLPVRTALIDGEMVVENESGVAEFSLLQADLSDGRLDRFAYYAFDCLYLDGYDLREAALIRRKELLEPADRDRRRRYSLQLPFRGGRQAGAAARLRPRSRRHHLEGQPIRLCLGPRQELGQGQVFGPAGVRHRRLRPLVDRAQGDRLARARRLRRARSCAMSDASAPAFPQASPRRCSRGSTTMRIRSSPFAKRLTTAEARQVRFVKPELIAEVDFRGWTGDGLLRQASFQGLRDDKPAREIVRETTMATNAAPERPKSSVTLTHPDRIYWPDVGVTKEGLADYYAEAWPFMKPLIVGRALALVRCPDGIGGQTFFQKHAWKGLNRNIVLVKDPKEPEPLISIRDFDGLMALVQSAALEIHPWGSTVTDWERPDMIVMDLDPGDDVDWTAVIAAAEEVRERLKNLGLASFVKTSGGKGLHVVSPIKPKAEWPAVKAFTKAIADSMAADSPDRFVSTIPKARRHGKILIDYLRNQRGMTAVAAYSTRARPGATVSMPLAWEELTPEIGPAYFTTRNAPARLSSSADPWADFRAAAAPIEEERKKAKPTRKR